MKKFYEAPVVELTGFSVEDVITTSVTIDTIGLSGAELEKFEATITGYDKMINYNGGAYNW